MDTDRPQVFDPAEYDEARLVAQVEAVDKDYDAILGHDPTPPDETPPPLPLVGYSRTTKTYHRPAEDDVSVCGEAIVKTMLEHQALRRRIPPCPLCYPTEPTA